KSGAITTSVSAGTLCFQAELVRGEPEPRSSVAPPRLVAALSTEKTPRSLQKRSTGAAVYECGRQVPSGVCSGGADRPRRRPRADCSSPPCSLFRTSFPRRRTPLTPVAEQVVQHAPRVRTRPSRTDQGQAAADSEWCPASSSPSGPPDGPRTCRHAACRGP